MKSIVLVIASVIASSLIVSESDASIGSVFSRPLRSVQKKAKNLKGRVQYAHQKTPGTGLRLRSAAPPPVVASTGIESKTTTNDINSNNDGDETDALCLIQRGPSFTKPPVLHFYSTKSHSEETRKCGPNVELEIKSSDGVVSENPTLDTQKLRESLIDTRLFDASAQTYFIVHGFSSNWNSDPWMCMVKDLILDHSRANVFIVNWSGGAKPKLSIDYGAAVGNTQYVGPLLGEFIKQLVELTGQQDARQYHMIGHSLGAHISGFAGYYLNGSLGRITALDPAGPCFVAESKTADTALSDGYLDHGGRRLSRSSANLVVALHTDATLLGQKQACAHYDVYVNGGYKQPDCGSTSLATRIEDLFHLNLDDAFNLNIGCAHSYSHSLLDKFAKMAHWMPDGRMAASNENDNSINNNNNIKVKANKCYPMAYKCANWKAFVAGECGFCQAGETRCVYTGLSPIENYSISNQVDDFGSAGDEQVAGSNNDADDDDDKFNDEDDDGEDPHGAGMADYKLITKHSSGKHFMRSGKKPMTCLYQYQIIIAAKKASIDQLQDSNKYYYYLHIPLELSGQLADGEGNRLHDRLVQVSHKLSPDSSSYKYLKSAYLEAIDEQDLRDELEFYTALITFEPIIHDERCNNDQTNGAGRTDRWQICNPLDNIRQARLWSSSDIKLDAVAWVGLNYMSGLDYEHRMEHSYVFSRNTNKPVSSREEIDRSNQAQLSETKHGQSASLNHAVEKVTNSWDCFLSTFDISQTNDAKYNYKCNRSGKELKYAIDLKPSKFGPYNGSM